VVTKSDIIEEINHYAILPCESTAFFVDLSFT